MIWYYSESPTGILTVRKNKVRSRTFLVFTILTGVSLLGALVLAELNAWKPWHFAVIIPIFLAFMHCLTQWFQLTSGLHRKNLAPPLRKHFKAHGDTSPHGPEPFTFEVNDIGISLRTPRVQHVLPWEGLIGVFDTRLGWICQGTQLHIVLKRENFGNEEGRTFIDTLVAHAGERGLLESSQIVAHLASNDFACPGCGYQLRGVSVARCPECARPLTYSDLPEAFA